MFVALSSTEARSVRLGRGVYEKEQSKGDRDHQLSKEASAEESVFVE